MDSLLFTITTIGIIVSLLFLYALKQCRNKKNLEKIRITLSLAINAGDMGVWSFDTNTQTFKPLYNNTVPKKGMTLEMLREQVSQRDRKKYDCFFDALLSGKTERINDTFRLHTEDKDKFYEVYALSVKKPNGNIMEIIGLERNITEEMKQVFKLEKNKQILDFIFDAAKIMPWEYHVDKRVFVVTEVIARKHNFPQTSITLEQILQYVHPADKPLFRKELEYMINETNHLMNIEMRSKAPERDEYYWFKMQGAVYRQDEEGHALRIIGLKHDISDRKNTEELIRQRETAEEANRLKSAFLANMSHEIRTPLNAIVGFSSLIMETDDREEKEEFIKIIRTNNENLLNLINDILDMSKIESGQMRFHYTDVDLNEIVKELKQTFRFRVKEGVDLCLALPINSYIMYIDQKRLTQVLSNFISNACKYTSDGSITIGYRVKSKYVYFYVTDTGKGILSRDLPHVFERFVKFDSYVQGTGLGLSICETIIEGLNGKIGVKSKLGKGSTFWFMLPIKN